MIETSGVLHNIKYCEALFDIPITMLDHLYFLIHSKHKRWPKLQGILYKYSCILNSSIITFPHIRFSNKFLVGDEKRLSKHILLY